MRIVPALLFITAACASAADYQPLVYQGKHGLGKGKHIVFVVGDQEYRSEESMPALARILADREGFTCTVLFPINKQTGAIDPSTIDNIPGLEALRTADLMVLFTRWVELPDDQMKEIVNYTNSTHPIVGLRTATHPFKYQKNKDSLYAKYSYDDTHFEGGYGRQVMGETWIKHYGKHMAESTRGVIAPKMEKHPILRGVKDIWVPSDVYEISTLSGDSQALVLGEVLSGMTPQSPPSPQKDKQMPIAWVKTYTGDSGWSERVFMTTMGAAPDFKNEGFRRLMVNACLWATGLDKKITPKMNVEFVGAYNPSEFGIGKQKTGVKPSDLK